MGPSTFPAVRLADVIVHWLGKVEIVLAGADEDLRDGQDALAAGDPMRARSAARRVLERTPESPIGLALLADACEAAHLDAELGETLEALAVRAPSRPEVWVRLGHARRATGASADEARDAFARALTVAEPGSDERRDALLGLADLDLAQGNGARAGLWLERVAPADQSADVEIRRAEALLQSGDPAGAAAELARLPPAPADARDALVRGRALAATADPSAFVYLLRALVLDAPGASDALSSALAHLPTNPQTRTRVRSVVDAKGEQHLARWRAAFARAEGARDAARQALSNALASGDVRAAGPLLDAAIDDRDATALSASLQVLERDAAAPPAATASPTTDTSLYAEASSMIEALARVLEDPSVALDHLLRVGHPRLAPWATSITRDATTALVPTSGAPSSWERVLARLDAHAHAIGAVAAAARLGELAADLARPVRLAIVGEFNAGKSTFINALLGGEIAPTGVLPTTATLHHLRWAPDPFAKIHLLRHSEPGAGPGRVPFRPDVTDRIVALADLRSTLRSLDPSAVSRVEIHMPLALLVRVEILDTPGFNAPDPRHVRVARSAFEKADALIWLLDATQALKQSEREILEQAQRQHLPVQLLVNKADRVSPQDLARVMDGVREALAQTGLASWAPPVALSAKRALAGKLGDDRALQESGWIAVESLLEGQIVARSGELKERAIRRRAAALVGLLVEAWLARVSDDESHAQREGERARLAGQAAARIERDAGAIAEQLDASLAPHAAVWERDMQLVFVGRDSDAAARDPVLSRYRADRALAILAPPLSRAMAALAPETQVSPAELLPAARAIVRTASSESLTLHAQVSVVAKAAVATLAETLFERSASPPRSSTAGCILRELRAFADALAVP